MKQWKVTFGFSPLNEIIWRQIDNKNGDGHKKIEGRKETCVHNAKEAEQAFNSAVNINSEGFDWWQMGSSCHMRQNKFAQDQLL